MVHNEILLVSLGEEGIAAHNVQYWRTTVENAPCKAKFLACVSEVIYGVTTHKIESLLFA